MCSAVENMAAVVRGESVKDNRLSSQQTGKEHYFLAGKPDNHRVEVVLEAEEFENKLYILQNGSRVIRAFNDFNAIRAQTLYQNPVPGVSGIIGAKIENRHN